MLYIPNNYLPQGVTGSHYNLWCLLRWDIEGFKTGSRPETTRKKTCIHSKHESTSNQPKKDFQRTVFILGIVSSCNSSSLPHVDAQGKYPRERGQHSLTSCTQWNVLWVHRWWCNALNRGHLKGAEGWEEMGHGNLTSNQVILYQEIQFPGMDFVFFPYTLPVYPHPASQRFSLLICLPLTPEGPMSFLKKCVVQELVSTICHGCLGASGTDAELSVVCWTTYFSISESAINI